MKYFSTRGDNRELSFEEVRRSSLISSVASMFPSTLMSTGGDEINMNCYDTDSETQANLKSSGDSFEQALSAFTVATHSVLEKKGKTPVVWEGEVYSCTS